MDSQNETSPTGSVPWRERTHPVAALGRALARRNSGRRGASVAALTVFVVTLTCVLVTPAAAVSPKAVTTATALAAVSTGAVPQPATGWSIAAAPGDGSAGKVLIWRSPRPLPIGDARIDITADGQIVPDTSVSADRLTVSARLVGPLADPASLQVRAGGRRLDGATPVGLTATPKGGSTGATPPKRLPIPRITGGTPTLTPLAPSADPGLVGPYATTEGEYETAALKIAEYAVPLEMKGLVVAPIGVTGQPPVALFLHGRHGTCYSTDPGSQDVSIDWPCPSGWAAIPSYRGYVQTQRLLASQGWFTISISANAVNSQDSFGDAGASARSLLVRAHLKLWAEWAQSPSSWAHAPTAVRALARPDLQRVLLIGHSRGGEGVNRASLDSITHPDKHWRIRGQVLIAPTAFGHNPAVGVPTVVLLPSCDGDVSDLQGQNYLDVARDLQAPTGLLASVLVVGANHNYFNAEWTPGIALAPANDDWFDDSDPVCRAGGPARLSAGQERQVGAVYTAAAARALVNGDATVLPLLDGSPVRAASAGTAKVLSHALGGRRSPLVIPQATTPERGTGGVRVGRCLTARVGGDPGACAPLGADGQPHFGLLAYLATEPSRSALTVTWARAGGTAVIGLHGVGLEPDATALTMRVVVPPGAPTARFEVRLVDTAGNRLVVGTRSLRGLPSSSVTSQFGAASGKYWAQEVRLSVNRAEAAATGVDLAHLARLEVVARSTRGTLWLLDAWGYRPGASSITPAPPVRFDVGRLSVKEGSSTHVVTVPIRISGRLSSPATIYLVNGAEPYDSPNLATVITVPAGTHRLRVPVTVKGNALDDFDATYPLSAYGLSGIVGGDYAGSLTVLDDDPSPALNVTHTASTVEGGALSWTFTLARPSNIDLLLPLSFTPPSGGATELTTSDVDPTWLANLIWDAPPGVPLSQTGAIDYVWLAAGSLSTTVEIPILADHISEGPEVVRILVPGDQEPDAVSPIFAVIRGLPHGAVLTGTVTDAP